MTDRQTDHKLKYLNNDDTKDFTIVTGDGHRVNKFILGLNSPVFDVMFK